MTGSRVNRAYCDKLKCGDYKAVIMTTFSGLHVGFSIFHTGFILFLVDEEEGVPSCFGYLGSRKVRRTDVFTECKTAVTPVC